MRFFVYLGCMILAYLVPLVGALSSYLLVVNTPDTGHETIFVVACMMFVTTLVIMDLRVLVSIRRILQGEHFEGDIVYYELIPRSSNVKVGLILSIIGAVMGAEVWILLNLYGML